MRDEAAKEMTCRLYRPYLFFAYTNDFNLLACSGLPATFCGYIKQNSLRVSFRRGRFRKNIAMGGDFQQLLKTIV